MKSQRIVDYLPDVPVVIQWLTGSGAWKDRVQSLQRDYVGGRCRLAMPDVALIYIVAELQRYPGMELAEMAIALSILKDLRIELKPLTIETASRAEALMRMCRVGMLQAVYMATSEQMGWRWIVAKMTNDIQRWGMATELKDLPGAGDAGRAQEVVR